MPVNYEKTVKNPVKLFFRFLYNNFAEWLPIFRVKSQESPHFEIRQHIDLKG